MKKVFSLLLVLMLVLSIAVPGMAAGKAKITLDQKGTVTLEIGKTLQLHATVTTDAAVTWKSSKKSVATVENGLVKPVKEGKATITAKAGGKTAKVTVKVVDPTKPTKLALKEGKKVTLDIDKTLKLAPIFTPATASSDLTYKTSKKSVATVENGVIKPHKEGKAKITVTATKNKKAKATITVTVKDPYKPTKLSINQGKSVTLTAGNTLQLTTTLSPATARNDLTYKSSKKSVATVDANGKVTAVKKGTAKITVTSKSNKNAKATITIKVNKAPARKDLTEYLLHKHFPALVKALGLKAVYNSDDDMYHIRGNGISACTWALYEEKYENIDTAEIAITGKCNYSVFNVWVGMSKSDARAAMKKAGLTYEYDEWQEEDGTEVMAGQHVHSNGVCSVYIKNGVVSEIYAMSGEPG